MWVVEFWEILYGYVCVVFIVWRDWWLSSFLLFIVRLDNFLINYVELSMCFYRDKNINLLEEVICILMMFIGMGDIWILFCLNNFRWDICKFILDWKILYL